MKGEPIQNSLRELVWRRKLTSTELEELRSSLEGRMDLELESHLTGALGRLPDIAVPSNFTGQVLQAIEREESRAARKPVRLRWNWRVLVPRTAAAAAVLIIVGLTFEHHELSVRRTMLAQSVARVATGQPMPSIDALKNFNAIQRMSQPHADEELLALLQ